MEARMPVQPALHLGVFVCGVVVGDQMGGRSECVETESRPGHHRVGAKAAKSRRVQLLGNCAKRLIKRPRDRGARTFPLVFSSADPMLQFLQPRGEVPE